MPTPFRDEFIEFIDGSDTLHCGTRAINCHDWSQLFGVGDSRGGNRIIPGTPGRLARNHVRDELYAELGFRINGGWDEESAPVTSAQRTNCLELLDKVRSFLDGADGRQLQVRLTTEDGTHTEACTFQAMGRVTFPTAHIAEFTVMIAVPAGIMPLPGASS